MEQTSLLYRLINRGQTKAGTLAALDHCPANLAKTFDNNSARGITMERNKRRDLRQKSLKNQQNTLESLMREYGDDVLRMAYLYVKDMHTAEDMFQETFLKVSQKLDTFEGRSSMKTWLLSIAMNTCRDYLKSAYHNKVVPMYDFAEKQLNTKGDFERLERAERQETIKDAVMELPEHYKDVVLCVYFRQLGMEETAQELGVSVGTVKSRLSRAKEKLRVVLERRLSDG